MQEFRKVCLSTAMDNESLEITFLKNGGVEISIQNYQGDKDRFISKSVEIPEKEWNQFCNLIGSDTTSTRKCSRCGQEGHNVRSCVQSE